MVADRKTYEKMFDGVDSAIRQSLVDEEHLSMVGSSTRMKAYEVVGEEVYRDEGLKENLTNYTEQILKFSDLAQAGNYDGPLQNESESDIRSRVASIRAHRQRKRGLVAGLLLSAATYLGSVVSLAPPTPDYVKPNPRGGPTAQYDDRVEQTIEKYGTVPAAIGRFIDQKFLETSTLAYTSSTIPAGIIGLVGGFLTWGFYRRRNDPNDRQMLFDLQKEKRNELREATVADLLGPD